MSTLPESLQRAKAKYQRKNGVTVTLILHNEYDADIIKKLQTVENRAGYVKGLILEQIAKEGGAPDASK